MVGILNRLSIKVLLSARIGILYRRSTFQFNSLWMDFYITGLFKLFSPWLKSYCEIKANDAVKDPGSLFTRLYLRF